MTLEGLRVVVDCANGAGYKAAPEALWELGAEVIEAPTIESHPPSDWTHVDAALNRLGNNTFDWVIFTSASGVTHTKKRLMELRLDARAFAGSRIAAIGPATADAVRREVTPKPTKAKGAAKPKLALN